MVSVCIDMMYSDLPFPNRIQAVKAAGFRTVEFWKWSNKAIEEIADSGVEVSIFNLDSRDAQLSYDLSRGILNDGRAEDFLSALLESIPVYRKLGARAMIVLIGEGKPYCAENVYRCLFAAKPILDRENVNLVIEPLNNIDRKGYAMPYAKPFFDLIERLNTPHIKMLYDIYHQNMMGDFSMEEIRQRISQIGHFHVADVPGRHEPGTGGVEYVSILREIRKLPYSGYIGLEYRATKPDGETFGFLKEAGYLV